MSFTRNSFKPSVLPASIWNDVNMEEIGTIEEEEPQTMEERGLLHKDKEDIIETLAADDVKEIDTSFETVFSEGSDREKEPRILESDEQIELLQEQILSEDSVDFHESVSQESSPLLPSIPSADIEPNLSEELIREVIRELHENHILSIGDSLKVWRKAISNKLRSETLSKSWNTIILDEIQKFSSDSDDMKSVGSADPISPVEIADNNETEPINEELAVVQALEKAIVSKRTTAVLELLERDEEEIEMKAEQLRSSLLERVKQRTQPHVEHFRKEINALKDVKKVLKEDGLLDTFSIIAQERGLNVDNDSEDESSASDDETKEGMIALSDDEDESMGSEDGQTQTPKVPPICGGHIKTVKRFVRNNARLSLKSKLQQKTLLQSSEMTAKRFGLTNSHDLVTVLGGMELERRRMAAKRAEIEAEVAARERKLALERKERARKFQEELALRADDSEGEFDDNDETFTMAAKPTEVPAVPLDYDEESGDEDNDKEMDEEEELLALQQLENLEESDQENAVNEATGLDDSDENEEGEVTRIDVELPNEDARDDIDNTPPGDSQSDTPTQGDAVGGDEENRTTTEDSVQVEIKESATSKSKAKAKNSIYAQLLLEEERQAKQQKSKQSRFLETEAEEDEEEGRQAGLGDFGFVIQKNNEDEEEAALKLRSTDLENIVDDLSDGEGDEEEGERQRLLEEARQDRIKTKKILEALANGQKGANRQQNENVTRGLYGLDELISGDIADSKVQKEDEEGELEENLDYDDDEELQAKYINQMKARIRGQPEETAIDELSDEEDENSDADENSTTLTPEEREMKAKIAAIEKENYRRYFEQALRNRALRNSNRQEEHPPHSIPPLLNQRTPSLVQGNVEPTAAPQLIRTSTAPSIPLPPPPTVVVRDGTELKRRVSMPPRKVDSQDGKIRRSRTATGMQKPKVPSSANNDFTGVLNKDELEAGHGLFMSVSMSKRRRASEESSSSLGNLFSGNSNSSHGPKRSFSTVISRRQSLSSVGGTAITVSSSQFVFLEDNSKTIGNTNPDEHSLRDDASSGLRSTSSNPRKRQGNSEDSAPHCSSSGLKRSKTLPTTQSFSSGTSLFDKLVERAGSVMSSHSCKAGSNSSTNPTAGKKLLLSGRIRSN